MKPKKLETVILGGGLDEVSPPMVIDPGRAVQIENFDCDLNRGYRVLRGYERFDGQTAPTDGVYYALELDSSPSVSIGPGTTVNGLTSGATARLMRTSTGDDGIYIVELSGSFVVGETINLESKVVQAVQILNGHLANDGATANEVRHEKEQWFKDSLARWGLGQEILTVGSTAATGSVLGVWRHLATTIAFRNKTGGTEAGLWRATASGWEAVNLGHIVFFSSAQNASLAVVGATVNDGAGNSATIQAAIYNTVGKTDKGYFVLSGYTTGFAVSAAMDIGSTAVGTVSVAAAAITLSPNGRYEFRSHNFVGKTGFTTDPDSYNIYGVDGTNPAFEYWPTRNIYVPLYSDHINRSIDKPSYLAVYKNQLFLGYARGIMRNSEPGVPYEFDAASKTEEINIGDTITGMEEGPKSLTIATKNFTYSLTGSVGGSSGDFVLDVASQRVGSVRHTIQQLDSIYYLDYRGIIDLRRTEAFGNFDNPAVSKLILPILKRLFSTIVASTVSRRDNIYRIFASNGEGISMTIQEAEIKAFSVFNLARNVTCACNAEDENGAERVFFGADNGYVYEMERGRSFDGDAKPASLQLPYHFIRTPTVSKKFYRVYFDGSTEGTSTVAVSAAYSLGDIDRKTMSAVQAALVNVVSPDSQWDVALWDVGIWDGRKAVAQKAFDLQGRGDSISLALVSNSASDDIYTLQEAIISYKIGNLERGKR